MIPPLQTPDAAELKDFLESKAGEAALKRLWELRPQITENLSIEATALKAREAKGWEECLKTLKLLAELRGAVAEDGGHLDTSKD